MHTTRILEAADLATLSDDEPALAAALRAAVVASQKPVKGIIGLRAIVRRARGVLALEDAPARAIAARRSRRGPSPPRGRKVNQIGFNSANEAHEKFQRECP